MNRLINNDLLATVTEMKMEIVEWTWLSKMYMLVLSQNIWTPEIFVPWELKFHTFH